MRNVTVAATQMIGGWNVDENIALDMLFTGQTHTQAS